MHEELIIHTCLVQISKLGISGETYPEKQYFWQISPILADGCREVWITLEWQTYPTDWTCGVLCKIAQDLQIQQCTLLTRNFAGEIIEQFLYDKKIVS
ncbi:hypothetical protein NIES2107_19810 [Nostoc carneum NIES-2107]|nr:hypothetical protein NIES2107_19810 [Nostoc carneum NIES-2107]